MGMQKVIDMLSVLNMYHTQNQERNPFDLVNQGPTNVIKVRRRSFG